MWPSSLGNQFPQRREPVDLGRSQPIERNARPFIPREMEVTAAPFSSPETRRQ